MATNNGTEFFGRRISRRRLLGTATAVGAAGMLSACGVNTTPEFDLTKPVKGGKLRVGLTGGTSADTVDAHISVNTTDICRQQNMIFGHRTTGDQHGGDGDDIAQGNAFSQ